MTDVLTTSSQPFTLGRIKLYLSCFSTKNKKKKIGTLVINFRNLNIEQHPEVTYFRGCIHISIQDTILTFFTQPTHSPLKTSNTEHAKYLRSAHPLVIRRSLKMFCFLILKEIMHFHYQSHKTILLLNVFNQSKLSIKLKTQQGR